MISILSDNALLNQKYLRLVQDRPPSQILEIQEKFDICSRNNCLNLWVIIAMKIDVYDPTMPITRFANSLIISIKGSDGGLCLF